MGSQSVYFPVRFERVSALAKVSADLAVGTSESDVSPLAGPDLLSAHSPARAGDLLAWPGAAWPGPFQSPPPELKALLVCLFVCLF